MVRKLVVVLTLLFPASAIAAGGPVVARRDGAALHARHQGAKLCVEITSPAGAVGARCETAPYGPLDGITTFSWLGVGPVGVAVGPDVAAVSVQRVDGESAHVPTVAAAGFAGRFAILHDTRHAEFLRTYDAGGTLIGTVRLEQNEPRIDTVRFPGVTVYRSRALDPDPVDVDHTTNQLCVSGRVRHSGASFCGSEGQSLTVLSLDTCAPGHPQLFGLAPAGLRHIEVTFGDGQRRTVATRPLPAVYGGERAIVAPIPPHLAVRSVRGGPAVRRLRFAPGGYPCSNGAGAPETQPGSGFGGFAHSRPAQPRPGPAVSVATAGAHRLLVADAGRRDLCAGVDRLERFCAPPDGSGGFLFLAADHGVVGELLPGFVESVRLRFTDGTARTVATTAGEAYTGRYAGRIRFLLADVGSRTIARAVALAAGGEVVGRFHVVTQSSYHTVRKRLTGLPLRVRVTRSVGNGHTAVDACVGPRRSGALRLSLACRGRLSGVAEVTCAPRRAVVFGFLTRGVGQPALTLRGGGVLVATVRRLPARQGGGRVWVAVVPRTAAVDAIVFPGAKGALGATLGREALHLPPAAEQCGYSASVGRLLF